MRDEMEGIFAHHTGRSVEEIRVDMDLFTLDRRFDVLIHSVSVVVGN